MPSILESLRRRIRDAGARRPRRPRRARRPALALLVALTAGCAATGSRPVPAATPATAPGCCCTLGTCRALSQEDCVAESQFQGWTYKWHPGACSDADVPLPR